MSTNSTAFNVDEMSVAIKAHLKLGELPSQPPPQSLDESISKKVPAAVLSATKEVTQTIVAAESTPSITVETVSAESAVVVPTTTTLVGSDTQTYDRWTLLDDTTIDYGYLHKTGGDGICADTARNAFYLTTAINYTNGPAHMGHAYEASTSDVIVRYQRLLYYNNNNDNNNCHPVFFLTGSDEHGQKIAQTAADQGKVPIDICNKYVTGFQVLNQRIRITNDDYLRTTSIRHKLTAHALWNKCSIAGDIYLDTYSGWYNVREETFVPENEAQLANYTDPVTGLPLKRVEEESYFFRMSKYKNQLINYIENTNPNFIQPEMHKNLILQRLKSDELRDLSISRTTFDWGISVPDGYQPNHVMYVWIDALSNYLTGVDALQTHADTTQSKELHNFWPASVHIIGKDILWFHTVIWPCLLMSAQLPLPQVVFAHGFVNDRDGKKMSKSLGNVIDPHDMLDKYHYDTFRWYLCKEASFGGELAFSEDSLRDMHNADLCDNIGNLVHRAASLCASHCSGIVPDVPAPTPTTTSTGPLVNFTTTLESYINKMNKFDLQGGANIAIQSFRDINGYLQTEEPWKKKGDENLIIRQIIVRACLEAIYAVTHMLLPFIPDGASKIFKKLGTEPMSLTALVGKGDDCRNLIPGTTVTVGDVLYTKALSDDEINDKATAATKKKESFADAQKRKKDAKEKSIAAQRNKAAAAIATATDASNDDDPNRLDFTKIDIRVGKIIKVWNHPDADKLFCEQIDLGEDDGPREVASGLRDYYTLEQMQDRLVLVVCNLKAAKIVGFTSNGMVLAAKGSSGTSTVELVDPPSDAKIGERVTIDSIDDISKYVPLTSTQIKKKKIWETVATNLKTATAAIDTVSGVPATWMGKTLRTSTGPCTVPSLIDTPIS